MRRWICRYVYILKVSGHRKRHVHVCWNKWQNKKSYDVSKKSNREERDAEKNSRRIDRKKEFVEIKLATRRGKVSFFLFYQSFDKSTIILFDRVPRSEGRSSRLISLLLRINVAFYIDREYNCNYTTSEFYDYKKKNIKRNRNFHGEGNEIFEMKWISLLSKTIFRGNSAIDLSKFSWYIFLSLLIVSTIPDIAFKTEEKYITYVTL